MPPYHLTNFEIKKYCQYKPIFDSVYSRSKLCKIKVGTYIINLNEYKLIGTFWIASCLNGDIVTYFDSFRVEHNPKEVAKIIGNKNVITNI